MGNAGVADVADKIVGVVAGWGLGIQEQKRREVFDNLETLLILLLT